MNQDASEPSGAGDVVVRLNPDEALVLEAFLSRVDRGSLSFEDGAEERVFNRIHAILETNLAALFASDYKQQLRDARARIRARPWDSP